MEGTCHDTRAASAARCRHRADGRGRPDRCGRAGRHRGLRGLVRRSDGFFQSAGDRRAQAVPRCEPESRRLRPRRAVRAGRPARSLRHRRDVARPEGPRRARSGSEATAGRARADPRQRLRSAPLQDVDGRIGARHQTAARSRSSHTSTSRRIRGSPTCSSDWRRRAGRRTGA